MKLTYIKQAGEPNGDAGDQYTGLDRFGRVVDQRWPDGSAELERVDYGFTAASNRQWRQNRVATNGQDEYYNYDGLYQVAELNRGTLNSGKTAITGTPSWTEDFTYDPIGNWDAYLTKVSGVTDLDQTRTHNTANQTTEIDGSPTTVAHDVAGNMVKVPLVADWSSTNELKWDAWNRLVEVGEGETIVAQYRYDGKTRRITKETDATRRYYYSDRWQILEERVDSETTAERQFVWGQRYLDDLVLRDRDVDDDGSLDERLYVLSDYFNPTAIADEDGVVLERYGYDAFGLSRVMDADFEPRSASDFDWETRYGAYRYDPETGFYQVRYRYLHPTLGRWLSKDIIQERAGFNLFSYVRNYPLNLVDYLGLAPAVCSCKEGQPDVSNWVNNLVRGALSVVSDVPEAIRSAIENRLIKNFAAGPGNVHVGIEELTNSAIKDGNIYGNRCLCDNSPTESAPSIMVCGVCIGTDKLGHFFEEGLGYFDIATNWNDDYAIAWGYWTEGLLAPNLTAETFSWLKHGRIPYFNFAGTIVRDRKNVDYWAQATDVLPVTGALLDKYGGSSPSDLAANEKGLQFYKALFSGDTDKAQKFNICDWVDSKWDQKRNPNVFGGKRNSSVPKWP